MARLNKAERPLLLVGHGVRLGGAEKLIRQFIENLKFQLFLLECYGYA